MWVESVRCRPHFNELAAAAPREQRIEEQVLRRPSDQSAAKFAEDRGIEPGISELQAQHIFPVDAAAHGMRGLAIGEPFGELEDGHECQLPGGLCRLPVCGEERQKGVIRKQCVQFIGHAQVPVALGKRGAGDTDRFRGDRFDRRWAKHGTPPWRGMQSSRCRGILARLERLRQQYQKCARAWMS
jgi:hypothetical protein